MGLAKCFGNLGAHSVLLRAVQHTLLNRMPILSGTSNPLPSSDNGSPVASSSPAPAIRPRPAVTAGGGCSDMVEMMRIL
jgi:hypothetical protein